MSMLEQIRIAIRDAMLTVPDIGAVHGYERYAANEKGFAALYTTELGKAKRELRGWFIRRVGLRQLRHQLTGRRVELDWQIKGFMALVDAEQSEIKLDDLVERLCAVVNNDLTLGGLVEEPSDDGQPIGLQLAESGPYMFGGVLCHGVRLDMTTVHFDSLIVPDENLANFETFHANWDIPTHGNVAPPLPADATADATDHVHMETN